MSDPNRPSFFKPLINKSYSTLLRLPIAFVRKHRNILPEIAKLRIRSGRIWTVRIEETDDDEECFFTDGWSDFVKDLELRRLQMLLFWLNSGDGVFDVSVYDSNSNEQDFSALGFRGRRRVIHVVESDSEEDESDDESRPRFQFDLTKSRSSRMILPKAFATAAGLEGKSGVVLQYPPRERYWAVVLERRKPPQNTLDLTIGWHRFVVENELVLGKNYSFEFNLAKNLILVSDCSSTSDSTDHTRSNTENVLKFVKEVKEHHFKVRRMLVPKEFGLGIGIATSGGNIELENSRGRKWPVAITSNGLGGVAMTGGLIDFLRENHVQYGDILLFESVPNSVAKVVKCVVTTNEVGKEMLARSQRGGFIKPQFRRFSN